MKNFPRSIFPIWKFSAGADGGITFLYRFFLMFICFSISVFRKKILNLQGSSSCSAFSQVKWQLPHADLDLVFKSSSQYFPTFINCNMRIKSPEYWRVIRENFPQLNNSIKNSMHARKEISWRKSKSNYDMQVEQTTSLSCLKCRLYGKRCSRVHWDGDEGNFFKHALDVEKKLLKHVFPFFCYANRANLKKGEIPNLSEFEKAPRGSEKKKIKKAPESISLGCY